MKPTATCLKFIIGTAKRSRMSTGEEATAPLTRKWRSMKLEVGQEVVCGMLQVIVALLERGPVTLMIAGTLKVDQTMARG